MEDKQMQGEIESMGPGDPCDKPVEIEVEVKEDEPA